MINAQEIQENEKNSWNADRYFSEHPELFESSINPVKMAIAVAGTLVAAGVNYVLWLQPQMLQNEVDVKMWILRIIAVLGLLYTVALIAGAKNYKDKISGGNIDTEYLKKYFTASYKDAKIDFEKKNFDEILRLPAISWYYVAPADRHLFAVAHNAEAKKFYCFLSYENSETSETEQPEPIVITDREYDRLLPMMEANVVAAKEVKDAENMEKNIESTPKI